MCVSSFHFEMRVASRVRRVVYFYLTGIDICRSIWVIKVQIMTEELELFSSYNEVNEHEELDI